MKVGDTFRIGGIPLVLAQGASQYSGCNDCAFKGPCTSGKASDAGPAAVNAVERLIDNDCIRGRFHYEVRK